MGGASTCWRTTSHWFSHFTEPGMSGQLDKAATWPMWPSSPIQILDPAIFWSGSGSGSREMIRIPRIQIRNTAVDSVVWCTLQRLSPRCNAHCGDGGVTHSSEIDSAVWPTPRRLARWCGGYQEFFCDWVLLTLRCDAHHGDWLCSMMHNVEFFEKFGTLDSWYDAHTPHCLT